MTSKSWCGCFLLRMESGLSFLAMSLSLSHLSVLVCHSRADRVSSYVWCMFSIWVACEPSDKLFGWFRLVSCREWNIFLIWCEYKQSCECVTLNRSDQSLFCHLHSLCDINQCVCVFCVYVFVIYVLRIETYVDVCWMHSKA